MIIIKWRFLWNSVINDPNPPKLSKGNWRSKKQHEWFVTHACGRSYIFSIKHTNYSSNITSEIQAWHICRWVLFPSYFSECSCEKVYDRWCIIRHHLWKTKIIIKYFSSVRLCPAELITRTTRWRSVNPYFCSLPNLLWDHWPVLFSKFNWNTSLRAQLRS